MPESKSDEEVMMEVIAALVLVVFFVGLIGRWYIDYHWEEIRAQLLLAGQILLGIMIIIAIGAGAWYSYKIYNAPENVEKRRIMRVRESILNEGRALESDMSTVKQAIGTYLLKIEDLGSVALSEFGKQCGDIFITERNAFNLITFAQQHKMIEGHFTKDGKRFLTKKYVENLLKSKLES